MSKKGFTLIELLIVVAIIGILAAIAIPNFLEAQVRAKVARVKADIKTIGTAMELYRVDYNFYIPIHQDHHWNHGGAILENIQSAWWLSVEWSDGTTQSLGTYLTSPIAYISSIPFDPFFNYLGDFRWPQGIPERTSSLYFTFFGGSFDYGTGGTLYEDIGYALISHGPDIDLDYNPSYDPTNGTTSNGDILFFGKGHGFMAN